MLPSSAASSLADIVARTTTADGLLKCKIIRSHGDLRLDLSQEAVRNALLVAAA
ncbi:MAG: hypothetical protein ABSE51_16585 [Terracidiphilus sp.]|jgi:hypothetical protein